LKYIKREDSSEMGITVLPYKRHKCEKNYNDERQRAQIFLLEKKA
jgi:hypothetical protein